MKTTVEIPDELMKAIKLRAIQEGKKLNEIMPELLTRGLKDNEPKLSKARIGLDKRTGLPVIFCKKAPKGDLTPAQLSEILLEQEASYHLPRR